MFRRSVVAASVCGLAVGLLPALSVSFLASPAEALTPPGSFTSEDLPTWQADGTVWAMAASHGRVFVGGSFAAVRPPSGGAGSSTPATNLAVLDAATGDPISSCSLPVTVDAPSDPTTPTVRALAVSPDGDTVYVGGYFDHIDGQARQQLAAVDVDTCTVVSGFVPLPNALVRAIATNGNAVYIGGSITQVAGTARLHAAAVQAVGAASPGALLPWAPQLDQDVRAIGVRPDGSAVAVGGDFDTADGSASHAIAVVNAGDGGLLHAFSGGFIGSGSVAKTIVADSSGFYSGYEGTGSGSFDGRVAIDWGTYAQRWRDLCLGATQALALEDAVLYSGSHAHDCGQMNEFADGARHHLLAQGVNNPALLSWYPNTNEGPSGTEQLGPRSLTVASDGGSDYLYVGGEFTSVNGHAQQSITRFGPGPDSGVAISAPTVPKLTVTSFRAGQIHVAWRPGIDSDDQNLTYQVFRDGSSTPIATQSAKPSSFWNLPQLSIDDTGLTSGSSHSYQVSASDGVTTVMSSIKTTHASGTTSAYASKIISEWGHRVLAVRRRPGRLRLGRHDAPEQR